MLLLVYTLYKSDIIYSYQCVDDYYRSYQQQLEKITCIMINKDQLQITFLPDPTKKIHRTSFKRI